MKTEKLTGLKKSLDYGSTKDILSKRGIQEKPETIIYLQDWKQETNIETVIRNCSTWASANTDGWDFRLSSGASLGNSGVWIDAVQETTGKRIRLYADMQTVFKHFIHKILDGQIDFVELDKPVING